MGENASRPLQPGDRIGSLEIQSVIGRGAFSTVFLAHDGLLERDVALKVLDTAQLSDPTQAREHLLREARMVARLSSPHVVSLHQVHELPGLQWGFEMEYMTGGSLTERIEREGALSAGESKRVLRAVLSGLDQAHRAGIVHHDIKPANVLLGPEGAVKLTDFGLGRYVAESDFDDVRGAPRRGTPYYMSPEVVMGLPGTAASDLWSVGVLLYRMLCGRLPFPARTLTSLFFAIMNSLPSPMGDEVSPYLASVALRCLAKAPQDRPASAGALLEEMGGRAPESPVPVASPEATAPEQRRLVGREAEMAELRRLAGDVSEQGGRTALVLGEPGIGKTALVTVAGQELRARGFRWMEARLSPLEGLRRPLIQALRRSLEREAEASDSDAGGSLPLAQETIDILERLRQAEDSDERAQILGSTWEIEQIFRTLAREKPLAVLIEDVHHCTRDEIRTLAGLSFSLAEAQVFLILTWRTRDPDQSDPESGPPSGYYDLIAMPGVERLELAPLDDRAIRRLVESTAGVPFVALPVLDRVISESEGVPLYAVSLYRHFEAAGEIETTGDAVRPTALWGQAPPPRFIRELVRRRLQGLAAEERLLLETASVAGNEFSSTLLAGLAGMPVLTMLRHLQKLYRDRALVEPLERGYRFAHALFRDAIYEDLAPDLRRALHEAWAEALEAETGEPSAPREVLGWHWEQAGLPHRAEAPLRGGSMDAIRRGELDRAWDLARRAGIFADDRTPEQLRDDADALLSLGASHVSTEGSDRLEALHRRLFVAADALGDDELRRRTRVAANWSTYFRRGPSAVERSALEADVDAIRHSICRLESLWLLSYLEYNDRAFDRALALQEQARDIAVQEGRVDLQAAMEHSRGMIERRRGDLAKALAYFESAVHLRARTDSLTHRSLSCIMRSMVQAELGDLRGALEAIDEPIRDLERGGEHARAGHAMVVQSTLRRAAGETREARAILDRAGAVVRGSEFRPGRHALLYEWSRTAILRGALGDAEESLEQLAAELGEDGHADLDLRRAYHHLALDDRQAAHDAVHRALERLPGPADVPLLSGCLLEMAQLALLGVALDDVEAPLAAMLPADPPPHVELPWRVLRATLHTDDVELLTEGSAAAADPRVGHRQAELAVTSDLLAALARLNEGAEEEAVIALQRARRRARELEHIWLELLVLRLLREHRLSEGDPAEDSVRQLLRDRNPDDPGRALDTLRPWIPDAGDPASGSNADPA